MHRKLRRAEVEAALLVFEAMPHCSFGGNVPEGYTSLDELRQFENRHQFGNRARRASETMSVSPRHIGGGDRRSTGMGVQVVSSRGSSSIQQQKRELTRARLLDAASVLFVSTGYVSTTAERIAESAGCSRAAFYLHFKSKADAMIGVLERAWPELVVKTADMITALEAGVPEERLCANLGSELALWLPHPGAITALNVAMRIDPVVADWLDRNAAIAIDMLAQASVRGNADEIDSRRAQLTVLSHMTLASFDLVDSAPRESSAWRAEIVAYLTGLWADLLFGDGSCFGAAGTAL